MTPGRLIVGSDSLGQLVNSRVPEIAIHLRSGLTHAFHIHPQVIHKQTGCIAATKLVWTGAILKGSEASGLLTNSRAFRTYS